jgi:tetratricopeptide (TPR) repeat protein
VHKAEVAIANIDLTGADVVLDLLHGLPLALTQAGSYMRETNVSALMYAKHYNKTWTRLMAKQGRYPLEEYGDRSVLTTWTVSYEQVQRQSKTAVSLLRLWGFLDSGELWYELIETGVDLSAGMDVPVWLHKIAEDELEFREAASLLCRYSLAEETTDSGSYLMHLVLHRWCSQLAEGQERYKLCCVAVWLVAANVPFETDVENWKKRKRLLLHGISVSRWMDEEHTDDRKVTQVLIQPVQYYSLGYLLADEDRQRATKMYQLALEGYEKTCGLEHTSTLNTVNNLGILYADLGKHKEAEKMYKRALEGFEKAWGIEHTSTLSTVNNLGILYKNLGKHKEAEKMLKRALEGYEKAWGLEHTSTLDTVDNIGNLYVDLGKHKEAEKMYKRALKGKEKAWGLEHTSTLITVNNLGLLYVDLGKHNEAEKMYKRALEGFEKAWGLKHTSTLETVNNLGLLYADSGKHKEAEKMLKQALEGREKAWGREHTSTLDTVDNIGNLYAVLGEHTEAEKMLKRALEGYEEAVGSERVSTYVPALKTMWALGSLSVSQGHVDEARAWYSKALLGYEKVFGVDFFKCQSLRNNLAALQMAEKIGNTLVKKGLVQEQACSQCNIELCQPWPKLASRRHSGLKKLDKKRALCG